MTHEYGDSRIVDWLRENRYHPRSPAHGSASCLYFLDDLLHESDAFRRAAEDGRVVYQEDYTVGEDQARWNTDLVVGPPAGDATVDVPTDGRTIAEAEPGRIWLAIDAKSVMTEHGKARRNRQRDINSFADIIHRHHPGAVTGGIVLLNAADRFKSPLRDEGDVTEHDRIEQLVDGTLDVFREIDRADGEVSPNVDGVACVVVEHTNLDDGHETALVEGPPAPDRDEIVHYRTFVEIISTTLERRFLEGTPPDLAGTVETTDPSAELRERVLELAHHAHAVSRELEDDADRPDLDPLRESVADIEAMIDRIEDDTDS